MQPKLSTLETAAAQNTANIEAIINATGGGHARIPKGNFPVEPITMKSNARISGCGIGLSTLYLALPAPPNNTDPQYVIATEEMTGNGYIENVTVSDITLNGNKGAIDWSNTGWNPATPGLNQGDAYGIWARNCRDSIFKNIEIIECWTDGVMFSIPFGVSVLNPSLNCILSNAIIRSCDRQAVSIVGGSQIALSNITAEDISQDTDAKPPGAAIDVEPGQGTPASTNIVISDIVVSKAQQGIISNGGTSSIGTQSGISISNVTCRDLNGPQALGIIETQGVTVDGFVCTNFNPVGMAGLGYRFAGSTGTASKLSMFNATNANYVFRVQDDTAEAVSDSDLNISNVHLDGCDKAAVFIGGNTNADNSSVSLSNFVIRNVYRQSGTVGGVIFCRSNGNVRFINGLMSDVGSAPHEVQLKTDASFEACDFADKEPDFLFSALPGDDGKSLGCTNRWNRKSVEVFSTFPISHENVILVKTNSAVTLTLSAKSEWEGNSIFVRHNTTGTPDITVKSGPDTIGTITSEGGALYLNYASSIWYGNSMPAT
jgi:hypothetical protein